MRRCRYRLGRDIGAAKGLPIHGSRKSATHGLPVRPLIKPAATCAEIGAALEKIASTGRRLLAFSPARTANGTHATAPSGKSSAAQTRFQPIESFRRTRSERLLGPTPWTGRRSSIGCD